MIAGDRCVAAAHSGTGLTIRNQVFHLVIGERFDISLGLPAPLASVTFGPTDVVTVISHPVISDRAAFEMALAGTLGDDLGVHEMSLDPTAPDPAVTRPVPDELALMVPTVSAASGVVPGDTPAGLAFEGPGVHAVEIEISIAGRRTTRTTTFVHLLAPGEPDQLDGEMAVALVMGQTIEPTVAEDGTVAVTPDDLDELGRLADTLAGIDAAAAASGSGATVPRGVFVEPSTLQAVMSTDPQLAARLVPGLTASDIIAAPRLPFEPSAAAAAAQHDRYTELLSEGEDLLSQLLPRTDIDRSLHLVRPPFTTAAAELQRKNVGARLMVLGFDQYLQADGGNGMLTDTSQLVSIALADNSTVPTALIDPHIAGRLENGTADPLRTSIEIAADLLVVAQSIGDDGGAVSRHGMVVARSDAGVPDAAVMAHLVTLLVSTDRLRLVDPGRLGSMVDVLLKPGGAGELAIRLPERAPADLGPRLELIDQISAEIIAFASMLPEDATQVDRWLQIFDSMASTAVTDDGAAQMVTQLRDEFGIYRNGILGPDPFTFTLTGRTNTLTFSLRNTTDTPLTVRVELSSPKLLFPDGDQMWELAPRAETEINVRAEALSNGKSSVFLRVYAPAESTEVQLIPEIILTARVSSLAGLGQLITGAGLLLLITWWGRHWRTTRRKRHAADHLARHPSANGEATAAGSVARS